MELGGGVTTIWLAGGGVGGRGAGVDGAGEGAGGGVPGFFSGLFWTWWKGREGGRGERCGEETESDRLISQASFNRKASF